MWGGLTLNMAVFVYMNWAREWNRLTPAGSNPHRAELTCMSKCPWARHWTPNCSWCAPCIRELVTGPWCTLPSPRDSWDWFQQNPWDPVKGIKWLQTMTWHDFWDAVFDVLAWNVISFQFTILRQIKLRYCVMRFPMQKINIVTYRP